MGLLDKPQFMKICTNCRSSNVCGGIIFFKSREFEKKYKIECNTNNLVALATNSDIPTNGYMYGDWCKVCNNFYIHTNNAGELLEEEKRWYE